jgi:STE24 endopeptidase
VTLSNPWFILALIATVGLFHVELIATLLNMAALKPKPPESLRAMISDEDHERALEYARVSGRFEVMESSVALGLLLAFWWSGGFGWLDGMIRGWALSPMMTGLAVIGVMFLLSQVVSLPFELWDTFVIEREFGFNKTTPATFIADKVKSLLLAALLGLPVVALLLWLFARFELAALYGWIAVSAFSLLISFIAPRLIMPLFFKFQPLEDAVLKEKIVALSQRLAFPVADVNVVDGSRRSTKANAFFAGFGKAKRIALFDTLLANHSHEEILAVLAHEVGHHKRGHVPRQMVLGLTLGAVMFALLHFALRDARLCAAFGVSVPSVAWGLVFFMIVWRPLSVLTGLFSGWLSRKYEFEADAFAKDAMGSPKTMTEALTKLSRDHLSNATPHPLYVALHYSHPPVVERIRALEV